MAGAGANPGDAVNSAGSAADMADSMATLTQDFGNNISPLYSGAPELGGSLVDYDIEGNERIRLSVMSSRSLAEKSGHAGGEFSETDYRSSSDYADAVPSIPRPVNF
ncbi:hypothetical protein [Nocardiopsis synnemataformans]|uniref:hypothetical protein n=1 Tax=Nocardiopsis synnemataformans TaxID=61305 RepID=UPI003EB7248C